VANSTDVFAQAVQYHQAGDLTKAEQFYRRLLTEQPNHIGAACNLGVILSSRGNLLQAEKLYRQALAVNPNLGDAHLNLGNLLIRLNKVDEAIASFKAALKSPNPPILARRNLWQLYFERGRDTEAVEHLDEYTRAYPEDAEAWHLLGLAHIRLGRTTEALPPLQRAIALQPGHVLAHNSLGIVKEAMGETDTAAGYFEHAIRIGPNRPEPFNNLALIRMEQGRAPEAVELFRRSLALNPNQPHVHSNYLLGLNYLTDIAPSTMLAEHRHWAAQFADGLPPIGRVHRTNPDGVLHIGYVSSDLRTHPVAAYLGAVLPAHDRNTVRVTCYSSVTMPDANTQRLRSAADQWRDIAALNDAEAAELIRRDHVDVLVDLSGHSSRHRLTVFARRPVPVQVTHFGYPNTTGLRAMDYRFTDAISDPPGVESRYAERLVRLTEVTWCWRPPDGAPDVGPLPADSADTFTFASLNNPAKLSQPALALWARILKAVPDSKLLLLGSKSLANSERLKALFAQQGAEGRLEVLPRMSSVEYYAAYNRIDLALDPFPYNGGVTTCDALWMGVPVVSLTGMSYAGRQGLSLLTAAGVAEFAAATADQYVSIAQRWATERDRLRELRVSLRERLRTSPICDADRFTRHLEAAYRTMVNSAHH
jgi:protein O-GlcNAc transferase